MIPFKAAGVVLLIGVFLVAIKYAIDAIKRSR
jgi:hypothetical protein